MGVSAQNNRINCAIAIWQWPSYFDPAQKLKGIRLDIAEYRRPDPRTAPSKSKAAGLYMICTLSKHAAEAKGYADALMFDWRGQIAEATAPTSSSSRTARSTHRHPTASLTVLPAGRSSTLPANAASSSSSAPLCRRNWKVSNSASSQVPPAEVTPVSEIGPYRFEVGEIAKTLMTDYSAAVQPKHAVAAE